MGGCFSILINILMIIYLMQNVWKLVFMQENIYYTQDGLVQPSLRGTIEYDHTDFMLFHTIRK